MKCCKNSKVPLLVLAACLAARPAFATTLRIAEYNIDSSDTKSNANINGANAGIPAVLQAMGIHNIGTNAQPLDVIAFTELLDTGNNTKTSTSLPLIVTALNNIYGAGTYTFVNTPDPTSGGTQFNGPSGFVYNTHTVTLLGATTLSLSGTGGVSIPRAPIRAQFQPVGYGANASFYIYASHYKADSGTGNESIRNSEAAEIRANADALPVNSHIIYTGDFNLAGGSSEPAYATLTAAGNGRAYDPTSPTTFISNFTGNSTAFKYLYSESTTQLDARFDMQLVSNAVLTQPGLQLATDLADPFDPNNFPSAKYPYAMEIFGNNGSTALGAATNLGTNTSLSDLANASTILGDLMAPSGSDHLPIVADYNLVGVAPPTVNWLTAAGGAWQTQTNWQFSGIPDATSDTFFNLSATYSVTASTDVPVKSLNIDTSVVTFALSGHTLNIATSLNVGATTAATMIIPAGTSVAVAGNTTINAGSVITLSGGTLTTSVLSDGNTPSRFNWTSGTLAITGAAGLTISPTGPLGSGAVTHGPLLVSHTLSIAGGSSLALGGTASVAALSLGGTTGAWTSTLDVASSKLVVEDTTNHAATLAQIKNQVAFGLTNPTGIISSVLPSNKILVVSDNAVAQLTNFGGINNVDAGSILVTVALKGDFNLDGVVDIQDLTDVANHWQQAVVDWSQGDADNSNFVDIQDLTAVANNWQVGAASGAGSAFEAFSFAGITPAPEPGSLLLTLLAAPLLLRKRSHRAAHSSHALR